MTVPSKQSFLKNLLDRVSTSFWFVPGSMLVGAVLLAAAVLSVDAAFEGELVMWTPALTITSPDGAQLLVSTVAGSLITLTGVVFSITVVALTLASQQFGPRLLRAFMRDRSTQVVLGIFVSTSLYCLLVLFAIRGDADGVFVPQLALLLSLLLTVAAIAALVFFLHHVTTSIHATTVVRSVIGEMERQIDELFPENLGESTAEPDDPDISSVRARLGSERATLVAATRSGYVRVVDEELLFEVVRTRDLLVETVAVPGRFVVPGAPLFRVGDGKPVDDELREALRSCLVIGDQRTPLQDLRFSIDQLVEVGLRALSPGVNDPHTAIVCVHYLGQGLAHLGRRAIPAVVRRDGEGRARVVARGTTFREALEASFVRIWTAADRSREVRDAILSTLELLETVLTHDRRRTEVRALARGLANDGIGQPRPGSGSG